MAVMMVLLLWREMSPQGSARVMPIGMEAYPGVSRKKKVCTLVNDIHFLRMLNEAFYHCYISILGFNML